MNAVKPAMLVFLSTFFFAIPAKASGDLAHVEEKKKAGIIKFNPEGQRFLSTGDTAQVLIDSRYIVKGDRLDIFGKSKAGELSKTGSLIVISSSPDPVRGVVVSAKKEINNKAYVDFNLTDERQNDLFLPFLQSMADSFHEAPAKGPLPVAIIDITTPLGHRTEGGDKVAQLLNESICNRGQFACADRSLLAEKLWQAEVKTSRNLGPFEEESVLAPLGISVYVTGYIKPSREGVDLILMARAVNRDAAPKRVWRRFSFPLGKLGLTDQTLEKVTLASTIGKKGRLKISLTNVEDIEGVRAEYVVYKHLTQEKEPEDAKKKTFVAGRFFASVDGAPLSLDVGGLFFDGSLASGRHTIEAGFYPEERFIGKSRQSSRAPVSKRFEVELHEGGRTDITLIGSVIDDLAILAIDLDWGAHGANYIPRDRR